MRAYIKDLRHRFSYELRPDSSLDAAVRAIASELEADGLLEPGASTAPRFQPHLTWCRAATLVPEAVDAAAAVIATCEAVTFTDVVTFGDGRIVCLAAQDRATLDASRAALLERIEPHDLDPAVAERPWTPHVTVAYAVPDTARTAARELVEARLPLTGAWRRAQCWDLDVRPTKLVHDVSCVATRPAG